MLVDNKKFTKRQIEIISIIGKEKRSHLDKEKRLHIVGCIISLLISSAIMILLSILEFASFFYAYIFIGIITLGLSFGIYKRIKLTNLLKKNNDYFIGLFYVRTSPLILGNSDKTLKRLRNASIAISVLLLSIAIFPTLSIIFSVNKKVVTSNLIVLSLLIFFIIVSTFGYFVYKITNYKKNVEKEKYNLDYTEEELRALNMKGKFDKYAKVFIKTKRSKKPLFLNILISVCGLILIIGSLFIDDSTTSLVLFISGLFFLLISTLGLFLLKNFEVLDGNNLIAHRFYKKKIIDIKNMGNILINSKYTIFEGKNGKLFCMVPNTTRGLNSIVDVLKDCGIKIEKF